MHIQYPVERFVISGEIQEIQNSVETDDRNDDDNNDDLEDGDYDFINNSCDDVIEGRKRVKW